MSPSAAAPPMHLHPEQHERFTVLSGHLAVRLGKTWSVLGPGQSVVVPPGVPHTLKNGGQAPAVITVELFPSRQMETFFERSSASTPKGDCRRMACLICGRSP